MASAMLTSVGYAQTAPAYRLGDPTVLKLAEAVGGPREEEGGAGNEQNRIALAADPATGKLYVIGMRITSNVSNEDRPWQCRCTSVELDPILGPTVVADRQVTNNNEQPNSERPCGHPQVATDGTINRIIIGWGEENNNGNVQPYVAAMDHLCNRGNRVRVNNDANANDGALGLAFLTQPTTTNKLGREAWLLGGKAVIGYEYNNNGERARGGVLEWEGTGNTATITVKTNRTLITPTDITRGRIVQINTAPAGAAPTPRFIAFSAKGNNRPPENGSYAQLIDAASGERLWDNGGKVVLASDPNGTPRRYVNMPEGITKFLGQGSNVAWNADLGKVAVMSEVSRGNNGGNDRGRTKTAITFIRVTDTDLIVENNQEDLGAQQVHSTMCASTYGNDKVEHLIIAEGTITRSGPPTFTPVMYDMEAARAIAAGTAAPGTKFLTEARTMVANDALNGFFADSGYLSNLYGQNPNTQGRDFLYCVGDLPNPGADVEGGFRPDVKSFFVFAYNGGDPALENTEPKNAAYLGFLPADVPLPPAPPPPVLFDLTITLSGDGRGSVLSEPAGIDCGSTCAFTFEAPTAVVLRARADVGSKFIGWTGDFVGSADAVVAMTGPRTLNAVFAREMGPVGPSPDPDPVKPPPNKGDGPGSGPTGDPDLEPEPMQPMPPPTTTIDTAVACGCTTTDASSDNALAGFAILFGLGIMLVSRKRG